MMPKTTIRVERARYKISQDQLANAISTSRQTVHAIEVGKNKQPNVAVMMKIAMFFGLKVEDFYDTENI